MIAEVSRLDPVDTAIDGDQGLRIAKLAVPVQINVSLLWGEVVTDFVHNQLSFINEFMSRILVNNKPTSQRWDVGQPGEEEEEATMW